MTQVPGKPLETKPVFVAESVKISVPCNAVLILDNGDVIVGTFRAKEVRRRTDIKDENGENVYDVAWEGLNSKLRTAIPATVEPPAPTDVKG